MKKTKKILTGLLMGIFILCNVAVAGAETVEVQDQNKQVIKSIVFAIGLNEYFVNGQTPGVKMDAAPFIENDRTFVPVRYLGNALGVSDDKIGWVHSTQKVTLSYGSTTATMTIGIKDIYSNGNKTLMDVSPQIKPPGRTFLPARYVAEALGYEVDWQNGKYVVVWPKGKEKPDVEAVKDYIDQQQTQVTVDTTNAESIVAHIPGAVTKYGVAVAFYEKGNPDQEAFFIQPSNEYDDFLLTINSYSDESLAAAKTALKIYYPTSYESAYNKVKNTIDTGNEIELLYYDTRSFGAKKFPNGTVVYIGAKGVK